MPKGAEILALFEKDDITPSLCYWTKLLNYFEKNINELDINDVRLLEEECERCRVYWNTDRENEVTITKPSGDIATIKSIKYGLGIEKKDTKPNIYAHLVEMERLEKIRHEEAAEELRQAEAKKNNKPSARVEPGHQSVVPLAAASA